MEESSLDLGGQVGKTSIHICPPDALLLIMVLSSRLQGVIAAALSASELAPQDARSPRTTEGGSNCMAAEPPDHSAAADACGYAASAQFDQHALCSQHHWGQSLMQQAC